MAHRRGGGNNSYFLNASTITDDDVVDELFGDANQDWFLAGIEDSVTSAVSEEVDIF
jgi:hypothetical protein